MIHTCHTAAEFPLRQQYAKTGHQGYSTLIASKVKMTAVLSERHYAAKQGLVTRNMSYYCFLNKRVTNTETKCPYKWSRHFNIVFQCPII